MARERERERKTVSGSTLWQDQNKPGAAICRHTPQFGSACHVQRRTGHLYPLSRLCPWCVLCCLLLRLPLLCCAALWWHSGCCKVLQNCAKWQWVGFGSSASSAGLWAADKQWLWRARSGLGQDAIPHLASHLGSFSGPAGAELVQIGCCSGPKGAVQAVPAVEMTPSDGQLQASPVDAAVPHTSAAQPRPT